MLSLKSYSSPLRRLAVLYLQNTRLTIAEKLTRLLAVCSIVLLVGSLLLLTMFFVTVGVAITLEEAMSPIWAYLIVAGFYVLLIVLLLAFRKALVLNPIARFVSKMVLDPPAQAKEEPKES